MVGNPWWAFIEIWTATSSKQIINLEYRLQNGGLYVPILMRYVDFVVQIKYQWGIVLRNMDNMEAIFTTSGLFN